MFRKKIGYYILQHVIPMMRVNESQYKHETSNKRHDAMTF